MNERELGKKFLSKFELEHPGCFCYRIPDSPVCRKPFDCFVLVDGLFTAIEFKMVGNSLQPHQRKALLDVKQAGGIAKAIWFGKDGKVAREEEP